MKYKIAVSGVAQLILCVNGAIKLAKKVKLFNRAKRSKNKEAIEYS